MLIIIKIKIVVGLLIKMNFDKQKFEDLLLYILKKEDDFFKKKIT